MSQIPIGWSIEGCVQTPQKQQVNDDRWYTKPAQTYFQKDIIATYSVIV